MRVIVVPEFLEWLATLTKLQQAQVQKHVRLLQAKGHALRMPHAKHIEGPFFELRPTANKVEIRVFYILKGDAWVLTGGQKSGQNSRKFYESQIERAVRLWKKYSPEERGQKSKGSDHGQR